MKRTVLIIPKEELAKQFSANARQDVKVVAPNILTEELFLFLEKNKFLKPEIPLDGQVWSHASRTQPNHVCISSEFFKGEPSDPTGPFALSFANEKAEQQSHYHRRHIEIYFSEHPLRASFRTLAEKRVRKINLGKGGALVFAPGVIHQMELGGLTMVLEVPAVSNDKVSEAL
ncbi:MAG: hypothetical protein HGB19_04315 [Chlorobiales bacterium]|jgi:hypothetical protein|nr:hypothetical protein [Chlorobiales bacterium]